MAGCTTRSTRRRRRKRSRRGRGGSRTGPISRARPPPTAPSARRWRKAAGRRRPATTSPGRQAASRGPPTLNGPFPAVFSVLTGKPARPSEHRLMARLLRIACFIWAPLGALPAAAQFSTPFDALFGQPPRPPSSVPGGRPQQGYPQYPDQRYPDQRYPDQRYPEQQQYPDQPYPGQARQAPPGGVQSQPLPPPEDAAAAVDPPRPRPPRG